MVYGDAIPTVQSDGDFAALTPDPAIGAVVCGFDFNLSFSKIAFACLCLQKNPGCLFLATSQDAFDTLKDRRIPAMTGALLGVRVRGWVCARVLSYFGGVGLCVVGVRAGIALFLRGMG